MRPTPFSLALLLSGLLLTAPLAAPQSAPLSLLVELELDLRGATPQWAVTAQGRGVDLAALDGLLGGLIEGGQVGGRLDLDLWLTGRGEQLAEAAAQMRWREGAFSDAAGLHAGEGLAGALTATLRQHADGLAGTLQATLDEGALYSDPIYLEPSAETPLALSLTGEQRGETLRLERIDYRHGTALHLSGSATIGPGAALQTAALTLHPGPAAPLYQHYLQPWLAGTALQALELEGAVAAQVTLANNALRTASVTLDDLWLADRDGRFSLGGADGTLRYQQDGTAQSALRWQEATVWSLPLAAAELQVAQQGTLLTVATPLRLPLLDGALQIETLRFGLDAEGQHHAAFAGHLEPISMARFSEALGWPIMSGELGGVVPGIELRDGRIALAGALLVQLFDGELVAHNLSLEQPFGPVPRLRGDLRLVNADLALLTRQLAFGHIEGRLDGHIEDLELVDWRPVRFNARLATREAGRRRISQRAVDNLASLGGGPSGVVSRGFLGLFETFPYRRIGLSCRLEHGICQMEGVAPAGEGYYIVQGGLLPRIDVIGHNRRVDWETLVVRLATITRAQEAVIR